MRLSNWLAPILACGLFAGSAVADSAGFGNAGAITGQSAPTDGDGIWSDAGGPERYALTMQFDNSPESQWYGFVGGDFERETSGEGELRSLLSSGSGYRFYNSDELRLSLQGGLSYGDDNLLKSEDHPYPGLKWGFNWEQTFFDRHLNFFHRHHGNQGFDSEDNLTINAETGFRVPLAPGFSATARYDLEWDRSPRDPAGNASHTYTLGLGYDW